ncbi:MAG: hypothetical protein Q8M73_09900 [Actinomycetota bacterium]|nr:hypothetical protein [Actinomycetota bacterium]
MRARSITMLITVVASSTAMLATTSHAATTSPSPTASATTTAPMPKTTVTLVVKGCEGCTIGVERGLKNEPASTVQPSKPDHWDGPSALVKNGFVTLTVPTAYTAGASFTVSAPWEGDTDGMTNIVLGGKTPPATLISVARATNRTKATACWAGTQDNQAIIRVTVIRRNLGGMGDKKVVFPIAWASPTVATVGPLTKTLGKGLLGNQDMFFC